MSRPLSEADLAEILARPQIASRNPRHATVARPSGRSPASPSARSGSAAPEAEKGAAIGARTETAPRGVNKYGAMPTEGPTGAGHRRRYDSKTSARLAERLERDKRAGLIVDYADEVAVIIGPRTGGGYVRARLDQLVLDGFTPDGRMIVRMLDAKRRGFDTPKGQAKHAALRQRGWKIEIIED